ncbi:MULTISPECIES: carbohydrate ABC transporter permease [Paenibacillus]|uniref:Binding-protein-dependent transport systems inner membrane component n=2 Tax=Paenibacillus lactis TaxID=228574 RepID=G4HN97_9BACL|nr:carbohydrate ABC transporter permease [Paenibacillus lactis]EHB54259.1 binding-protein-dependent transport systems inner membrane component [Paenibacillus lactis 154]MBP1896249.1 multiple sugar transport system permease protein [Paenibacillus lactis]MCM3497146.1 carbohydrate ABC transporter permease [Paenibacillus lactis]HAF96984.1 carbohydrate ABC transporter permease [Paenibacillus lactis]
MKGIDRRTIDKTKRVLWGFTGEGIVYKLAVYFLLSLIGFVYLYPLFYMITYSFMNTEDLINPLITYIPSGFYMDNFAKAAEVMDFLNTLWQNVLASFVPAVVQTVSAAVIGYGFARFRIPGKSVLFALVLATFIIPPQITMIPQFLMFKDLGLIGSIFSYIIPAAFGQGIKSGLFILIFYQFFRSIPKSLEEAAQIDGAGAYKIFAVICVPMAVPAFIISFLFSMVWYWNETLLAALYLGDKLTTLPLELQNFAVTYQKVFPADPNAQTGRSLNEAINMAGTFLNIIPLLIVYFFTQRWFVESIERSGITGE